MENSFRIIYALCIFFLRFPLYYLVPIEHISYTSVINNDTSLCNNTIKEFLCKSEFTKDCTKLNYPRDIDKLTIEYESLERFLCLGMHDAVYKVCQYIKNETWTDPFSKKEDLDISIQNFTGYKPNGESLSPTTMVSQENFCERLKEFTPMYGKVQPALEKLAKSLKVPVKCIKVCFDLNDRLNPLCAVLAWVNQIDQTVKKNAITKLNKATVNSSNISKSTNYPGKPVNEANKNHDEHSVNIGTLQSLPHTTINDTNTQNNKKKTLNADNSQQNATAKSTSAINKSNSQADPSNPVYLPDTEHGENHDNNNKLTSVAISDQQLSPKVGSVVVPNMAQVDSKAASIVAQVDSNVESNVAVEEAANIDPNVDLMDDNVKNNKNVNNKTIIASVEVKSTTLSENTQDNIAEDNAADNPNPDDFISRLDDEPLPNNFLDTLSQPIDTDNRNENIPETSGQREMDNFHVIKDDEESHVFTYFAIISLGFIAGYIGYHNKQKILAIVLEGRRSKNNRGRRRPSTANYRKLDCTLEEAVTSQCNANVTHVIY